MHQQTGPINVFAPQEVKAYLQQHGFVHVTGLTATSADGKKSYVIGQRIRPNEFGTWGYNNGIFVHVTLAGQVWVTSHMMLQENRGSFSQALALLSPNGQGAFVPFSNGESADASMLLRRIKDPNYHL